MNINEMSKEQLHARYLSLAHAMQSAVQYQMSTNPNDAATTPKHLRVGVNAAMVEHSAIAKLLIDRGVFTEREYFLALVDAMQAEVLRYETELGVREGTFL